jgi:deoxycytidylate deaminase
MPLQFNRYLEIAKALLPENDCKNKHFSFIISKSRIMSIGINSIKTHPKAAELGYIYPHQHSELSAIIRFPGLVKDLQKCSLINIRLNNEGTAMISRPCKNCRRLIFSFAFKQVFYTNKEGNFEEFSV